MAIGTGPTAKLCDWLCSIAYEELPTEVRKETVTLLCDQVAGMIAAATLPSCQPLVDLIRKLGPQGECSIVGHPLHTSVTNAALANGTIGHGAEVDATGQHGTWHYAATIVPTALTVGQYVDASGKEFIRALALGSEVAARVQSILRHYRTRNQFHASVGGTLGAAVSAGLLLRLNSQQMEYALGLAASGACGLSSAHLEELHQTKSLHHGRAAEAGVLSALLAREGYHGPREVLTVENGFYDAFLGMPEAGHEVVDGLGEKYLMREIVYKRYPVGGPNQTPLYSFLQLIKEYNFSADDIGQIEISLPRHDLLTVTTNKHPSVHMETIFCLAAVYGEITFSHINDPSYLVDPRVQVFKQEKRIVINERPKSGPGEHRWNMDIIVRTRLGKTLHRNARYPLMTEPELQQKFRSLAALRLDGNRVSELEGKLKSIESELDTATLVRELELPYKDAS